ncbi:hypothetical protein EIL87_25045 [Saccharopolyspora rhizosphaerae]|uniref:ESX-1 secretion-associated protein n=1 Tax=Saccharopolyspora rhizosphaerae TaxID=2492662 RepID=A0A3R8QHZ2_9PSEU|nr:hypothetical protein [Saccharopolyspora rhizosphaerae]RRO12936.1 hypothetical protein EIL87_25045 [Saccharopolyspora rhizosphaerae]
MSGLRIDVDWLATHARQVREAGEDITSGRAKLTEAELAGESFGQVGRCSGALEAYQRLCEQLLDRHRTAAETLTSAGEELREVVDHHAVGDDDSAVDLRRQEA